MFRNERRQKPAVLFALLAAGIALVLFGAYLLRQNVDTYVETAAVISRVDRAALFSNAYVDYTADGRRYEGVLLGRAAADDEVGREVVVYYDPEDPSVIESQGGSSLAGLALLIGVLLTICAALRIFRDRRTIFVRKTPCAKKRTGGR